MSFSDIFPPDPKTLISITLSCGCVYRLMEKDGGQEIRHSHHNGLGRQGKLLPVRLLTIPEFIVLVRQYLIIQQILGYERDGVTVAGLSSPQISGDVPFVSKTDPEEYAHIIEEIKNSSQEEEIDFWGEDK